MPDLPRPVRYFYVTGCLTTPQTQLRRSAHYRALLRDLDDGVRAHPVQVLSFCLLPTAWHLVVAARGTRGLGSLIEWVRTTRRLPNAAVSQHPMPVVVTPLISGGALLGRCVMVERRPVATGLVSQAQDWPWCSAAERFRLQTRIPLVSARILLSQAWFDHLNSPRPGDASRRVGPHDLAEPPRLFARPLQVTDHRVDISRAANQDQPHTHVERPEHLRVGHASGTLKPGKHRGYGPATTIE